MLPPIGHTCNYPSQQSEPDLSEFVRLTQVDATVIGTTASVAWEWWDTWRAAMQTYFPKYATKNVVRSDYAMNVPFLFDTLVTWTYNNFNVYGAKYVLFRPHVWRGTKGSLVPGEHDTLLSLAEMASQINGYPKGTATHIYLTSGNLQDLYDLVAAFDDHVEDVSHNVLADKALGAGLVDGAGCVSVEWTSNLDDPTPAETLAQLPNDFVTRAERVPEQKKRQLSASA